MRGHTEGDPAPMLGTAALLLALFLSRPLLWLLDGPLGTLGAGALVQTAVLLVALALRRRTDVPVRTGRNGSPADPRGMARAIAAGIGLFVLTMPVYAVASSLAGPPSADLRPVGPIGWSFAAVNGVTAAVGEELAFRGALWPRWRDRLGDGAAALLTSLAFAAYHMSALQLAPTFLLGLGLVLLTRRQGHLAGAIVAHLVFNGAGFVLLALLPR